MDIVIVILTLGVAVFITWMMRRDFQKRMLMALRSEILTNMERIQEYIREMPERDVDGQPGAAMCTPVLTDSIFRKIQKEDFRSKGFTNEDKEKLEKFFTQNFQYRENIAQSDSINIYREQIHILEGIQTKIDDYLKNRH